MATRLRDLAIHARNLLDCDQASLCLYCPEAALRHPLLALFCALRRRALLCYGSSLALQNERVWALCAQALQSGCRLNRGDLPRDGGSVAVAVLERPAGVLGFLLCVSSEPGAFQLGECRLLAQYLPELARQVERALSVETTCTPIDAAPTNSQEQNAFISMVSHELRVPLTAIKGYAGLLQAFDTSAEPDEGSSLGMSAHRRQQYLNVIMEQTSHLEVLIGDVLDISRIQAGRLALHYARVDLARLCRGVAQLMQSRADQQQPGRYRILCSIEPALPFAWADADRVQQVLANLVENALKYSPAGGLIELRASIHPDEQLAETMQELAYSRGRDASHIYITVHDHGIGIAQQQQAALFKPFTRLEHPATRHVSGAGLGLYIARRLVEAMHGRLTLQSSEGEGTRVTFTLPIDSTPAPSPTHASSESVLF
ncbi:MAG TPA: HAMP domain-containing sensor histidine kinase [Ktedonobacteraceae bacterium]|nr:HAMP domain-containing sensor histidine kinase [Ktedonobacteraceae bacterium]